MIGEAVEKTGAEVAGAVAPILEEQAQLRNEAEYHSLMFQHKNNMAAAFEDAKVKYAQNPEAIGPAIMQSIKEGLREGASESVRQAERSEHRVGIEGSFRDGLDDVPVFGNLAVLDAEDIHDRGAAVGLVPAPMRMNGDQVAVGQDPFDLHVGSGMGLKKALEEGHENLCAVRRARVVQDAEPVGVPSVPVVGVDVNAVPFATTAIAAVTDPLVTVIVPVAPDPPPPVTVSGYVPVPVQLSPLA